MARFLIEGTWNGYRAGQDRVVHREVTTDSKLALWVKSNYSIVYTDGTCLVLSARELNKGERVKDLKNGYSSLIRDCAHADVNSVQALLDWRKQVNG